MKITTEELRNRLGNENQDIEIGDLKICVNKDGDVDFHFKNELFFWITTDNRSTLASNIQELKDSKKKISQHLDELNISESKNRELISQNKLLEDKVKEFSGIDGELRVLRKIIFDSKNIHVENK